MTDRSDFFVSPEWLEENLDKPGLSIVDGAWYLPAQKRDARGEYDAGHIPQAVFFDHDQVVDPDSDLPHTLPRPEDFARIVGAMGIAATDEIVVYDGPGLFTAPRVWWMFRTMGAKNVRILEGGLDAWKAAGRPLTAEVTKTAPSLFDVDFDEQRVATLDRMTAIVGDGSSQIADARPAERFRGDQPEPRTGVRGGHMPGARSLPAMSLSRDGKLVPEPELRQRIREAGIDLDKPVVTSCGSGITAAVITLALETLGHTDNQLYDGSWTEWGGRSDTPVVQGKP